MILDFDDFCTWMFVIVDNLWQGIAPLYRRPGPEPSSCSDSELITVAIISECRTWDRETQALLEWTAYRDLFPRLPERSRFNRRRRNLMCAINQIRQLVLTLLDVAQDAFGAIDSLPVPAAPVSGALHTLLRYPKRRPAEKRKGQSHHVQAHVKEERSGIRCCMLSLLLLFLHCNKNCQQCHHHCWRLRYR